MKPFQFRLATLLEFRKRQEEQLQAELNEALIQYKQALEDMKQLKQNRDKASELLRQKQQKKLKIEEFKLFQNYLDKINVDIKNQHYVIENTQHVCQECQKKLLESAKKSKIVEKLKEKRYTEYCNEQLQEEQKAIDEVGIQVFARKKAGNSEW